jgi:ABC-type nitrate/sulfonate/bicarbonate transport system permease component
MALWQFAGAIWHNALCTFRVTLLGFAVAVVFGLVLGVAAGASPLAYAALSPLLIGFNSIPKVAIVPILVIWFGIGTVPAVLRVPLAFAGLIVVAAMRVGMHAVFAVLERRVTGWAFRGVNPPG